MSHRPSFFNPFGRGARKTRGSMDEGTFGDAVSPLDTGNASRMVRVRSGERGRSFRLPPPSASFLPQAAVLPYGRTSMHDHQENVTGQAAVYRRGSLFSLKKSARKVLSLQHIRRKLEDILWHKRPEVSPGVAQGHIFTSLGTRNTPPRPPRPPVSLDIPFLEDLNKVLESGCGPRRVPDGPPRAVRGGIPFPMVAAAQPVPASASIHSSFGNLVPPREERAALLGARELGVSPEGPARTVPIPPHWRVVQHNLLSVPPSSSKKWLTSGVLGLGGFGRVYLVFNTETGTESAMKVVHCAGRMSRTSCRGVINEIRVLSFLASSRDLSPFLLRPHLQYRLWAWQSSMGYLHILTEVCTGGELTAYKGKLAFDSLILICAEVILGLDFLHRQRIIHHDIKPHNIMINENGHCVIGDYGGVQFMNTKGQIVRGPESMTIMTKMFAPPELLCMLDEGSSKTYDERADYWSLGTTMVWMLMEDEYLPGASDSHLMAFRVQRIRLEIAKRQIPVDLQAFVLSLLEMDVQRRPRYATIVKHTVFRDIDWQDVHDQKCPPIPIVRTVAPTGYGWQYETPKVHQMRDSTAVFLDELRDNRITLPLDDSYDVEQQLTSLRDAL